MSLCIAAQKQACGLQAADMATKCVVAGANPADLAAGAACCAAAQPVVGSEMN